MIESVWDIPAQAGPENEMLLNMQEWATVPAYLLWYRKFLRISYTTKPSGGCTRRTKEGSCAAVRRRTKSTIAPFMCEEMGELKPACGL